MPRSLVLTAAMVLGCVALLASVGGAFVAAPLRAPAASVAPATGVLPTAALSAAALVAPTAAYADGGSVWIPALSAVGAGFAVASVCSAGLHMFFSVV